MSRSNLPTKGDVVANRYRLGDRIGSGGFGVIYQARQRRKPHRVALKIMSYSGAQVGPAELKRRFRREAVMASNLIHPHAVRQFDFGDDGDVFYLAMELLDGETLGERIERQGALSSQLVVRIARASLEVLHLAHEKDIVHRDLKPHNIMLCQVDGDPDFPKVLDFGAAKTTHGQHDLTSAGIALGSPAYMAPEILRDEAPLPASDLYSLAVTLGEAIAGEMIVPGDDAIDQARNQLSTEPLDFPDKLVDSPLYPWLAQALEKALDRRVSSAQAMLAELEELERRLGWHDKPQTDTGSERALDTDFSAENTVLISGDDNPLNQLAEANQRAQGTDDFEVGPTVVATPDAETSPMMETLEDTEPEHGAPLVPQNTDAPTAQMTNPLHDLFPSTPTPTPTPTIPDIPELPSAIEDEVDTAAAPPAQKQPVEDFDGPTGTDIAIPSPSPEPSADEEKDLDSKKTQLLITSAVVAGFFLVSFILMPQKSKS